MNQTQEIWNKQQASQKEIIKKLETLLQSAKNLDVDINKDVFEKFEAIKSTTKERKLRIVLAGGFSEGKTSIVAAWLGKLDKSTMKISQEESSDEIKVYNIDGNIEIVDTPGLFGFKEKENGEKYKDITQKYISKSDILLYIMNPNNPIKESHRQEIITLFNTIDLLSRTIFVISQFDKEADLEIEKDYNSRLNTKIENIKLRLKDFLNLKDEQLNKLTIVAVSADPYEKGIEYWLQNNEDFKRLSHIENLQKETTNIIEKNGGPLAVIKQTEKSIIKDILNDVIPKSEEKFNNISLECSKMGKMCEELTVELDTAKKEMADAKIDLRNKFVQLFTDLILQTSGLDLDTYQDFFERNIGNNGIVLDTKIKNLFEGYINTSNVNISRLKSKYNQETNHFLTICEQYKVKDMLNNAKSFMTTISGQTVLSFRNALDLPIKFKPWGAVNLASNISKWGGGIFAGLGLALEAWETWDNYKKNKAFNEMKEKFKKDFDKQREEILAIIDNKDFEEKYLDNYIDLIEKIQQMNSKLKEQQEKYNKFESWKKDCEIIEAELIEEK